MADDDKLKTALVSANDLDRNDLIIKSMANNPLVKEEYKGMLKNISTNLPAIKRSSSNFYKSHSQFMGVMLDVTAITPIRSIKHTLAELDKTRMALEEAHLKMMKKDIELREKEKKLTNGVELEDGFAKFHKVTQGGGEGANRWYRVVVREGRKREVRRLWEFLNFKVSRLIRIRFGDIRLPDKLRSNQFEYLKPKQVQTLLNSVNLKD